MKQDILKSILDYNTESGLFRWKIKTSNRISVGSVAGNINKNLGYIQIRIHGKLYYAHRLAWLYIYGEFPIDKIDHINGVRDDNRISNLRLATQQQNIRNQAIHKNNTSGYKGVCYVKTTGKYLASCTVDYVNVYIGTYDTAEEASIAYINHTKKIFGEYYYEVD